MHAGKSAYGRKKKEKEGKLFGVVPPVLKSLGNTQCRPRKPREEIVIVRILESRKLI
jgi:hypothetical protein